MEIDTFGSEIGSGFGESGGTSPPRRIPRSTPPPLSGLLLSHDLSG